MHEGIRDDRPWPGDKVSKLWWNRKLIMNNYKYWIGAKNFREYPHDTNRKEHHHIDDDQLGMPVVGATKSRFEFFQHLPEIIDS